MDYKTTYRTAFDFHNRWLNPPENMEAWQRCVLDMGETANGNGNDPFLIDLLIAIYSEIERQYKKKEGETH